MCSANTTACSPPLAMHQLVSSLHRRRAPSSPRLLGVTRALLGESYQCVSFPGFAPTPQPNPTAGFARGCARVLPAVRGECTACYRPAWRLGHAAIRCLPPSTPYPIVSYTIMASMGVERRRRWSPILRHLDTACYERYEQGLVRCASAAKGSHARFSVRLHRNKGWAARTQAWAHSTASPACVLTWLC